MKTLGWPQAVGSGNAICRFCTCSECRKTTLTHGLISGRKQNVAPICSIKLGESLLFSKMDHAFPVGRRFLSCIRMSDIFMDRKFLFVGYHCMHLFQSRICVQLLSVSPFPFDWICSHLNTRTDPTVVGEDLQRVSKIIKLTNMNSNAKQTYLCSRPAKSKSQLVCEQLSKSQHKTIDKR